MSPDRDDGAAPDDARQTWITILRADLIEVQSLESGLQAIGIATDVRETPADDRERAAGPFQLRVPAADAAEVRRYVEQYWRDRAAPEPAEVVAARQRAEALGLRVRHGAFMFPPMVCWPAVKYLFVAGMGRRPAQHRMSLVACWFAILVTLGALVFFGLLLAR